MGCGACVSCGSKSCNAIDVDAQKSSVEHIKHIIDSTAQEFMTQKGVSVDQIIASIGWLQTQFRNGGGSPQLYEKVENVIAYLCSYTPRYMHALFEIMMRLVHCGLIPTSPRMLDIGAGCGTSTLALTALLFVVQQRRTTGINPAKSVSEKLKAEVVYVDVSSLACDLNAKMSESIVQSMPFIELNATPHICDIRDPQFAEKVAGMGSFDIVILSNVLNELRSPEQQKRLVRVAGELIDDRGMVIIIEPAVQSSFRQVCYQVCQEASSSDGLTVFVGPCYHDCKFSRDCWAFSRGTMEWGNFELSGLPGPPNEYRYSSLILRRDGLRSSPPVPAGCQLSNVVGRATIDTTVLVAAYVPARDGWYPLCDGISGPNLVWLSASSLAASQSLQAGRVYRIRSDAASWRNGVSGRYKYSLYLPGSDCSIELVSCYEKAVNVGTRFKHETLGPVRVEEQPPGGCRSNARMFVENNKMHVNFSLGHCFDRLILRLV